MSKKEKSSDLSINGPGSPVSIKKFNDSRPKEEDRSRMPVLIDDGIGIAHDDPDYTYITPEECSAQAVYFLKNGFNPDGLPAYLYRYLAYVFQKDKQFDTNQEYADAMNNGTLDKNSDEYKEIINKVKYLESNQEAKHIIGFIQLFAGCLNQAKKMNKPAKLFIQEPETNLHPKRAAMLMSLIEMIKKEYEFDNQKE